MHGEILNYDHVPSANKLEEFKQARLHELDQTHCLQELKSQQQHCKHTMNNIEEQLKKNQLKEQLTLLSAEESTIKASIKKITENAL